MSLLTSLKLQPFLSVGFVPQYLPFPSVPHYFSPFSHTLHFKISFHFLGKSLLCPSSLSSGDKKTSFVGDNLLLVPLVYLNYIMGFITATNVCPHSTNFSTHFDLARFLFLGLSTPHLLAKIFGVSHFSSSWRSPICYPIHLDSKAFLTWPYQVNFLRQFTARYSFIHSKIWGYLQF